MTPLQDLYRLQMQSPWLDNLRRDELRNGHIENLIERGVRGITSNPTIFQKAITSSSAYDEQISELTRRGLSTEQIYWELVVSDVIEACSILAKVYERSNGEDGFVSLEVDPHLAADPTSTAAMARELADRVGRPNLMIKVPATAECLPAITEILSMGISVNVTLIFGLPRYRQVLEAFMAGVNGCIQTHPGKVEALRSVASFFISRVDSAIDPRLVEIGREELCGQAAVHQARAAYVLQREFFASSEWTTMESHGAKRQRPLWASTSTKNPHYPDLLYVDQLIGPDSVNTLPEQTLLAFEDHGTVDRTIDRDVATSIQFLDRLGQVGVDIDEVAETLERDGIASFAQSFDQLLEALHSKVR
ncbi:MAG: transaldolase [Actinomycetota bacterium]